jgi:hypothetical protein
MMKEIRSSENRFLEEQYGNAAQKTEFFELTAVKGSSITNVVVVNSGVESFERNILPVIFPEANSKIKSLKIF